LKSDCVIKKVEGLFEIVNLKRFRETECVRFDIIPNDFLKNVVGVDRVLHLKNAVSPGSINDVERPWYMHTNQGDNLVVLYGERHVDLYSTVHGKMESFVVTPEKIYMNGELICDHPAILAWPAHVFHRVESKEMGSASINFAFRDEGFNVEDNFNIYDLNINTGNFNVLRKGKEDQF